MNIAIDFELAVPLAVKECLEEIFNVFDSHGFQLGDLDKEHHKFLYCPSLNSALPEISSFSIDNVSDIEDGASISVQLSTEEYHVFCSMVSRKENYVTAVFLEDSYSGSSDFSADEYSEEAKIIYRVSKSLYSKLGVSEAKAYMDECEGNPIFKFSKNDPDILLDHFESL